MIITCDHCNTRFKVSDNDVGPEGRFVRCSKCHYEWVAKLPEGQKNTEIKEEPLQPDVHQKAQEETVEPPKNNMNLLRPLKPPVMKAPPLPFYQKDGFLYSSIAVAITSILIFLFFVSVVYRDKIIHIFPKTEVIYNMLGMYHYTDLVFEDISCKLVTDSEGEYNKKVHFINLDFTIKNNRNIEQTLSYIKITTYDNNMNRLGDLIIKRNDVIKPGGEKTIVGSIDSVSKHAAYVSFEVGNYIDLHIYNSDTLKTMVPLNAEK